jgi:copper(I)-binding protein
MNRLMTLIAVFIAASAAIATTSAHDGHDHGSASPEASPVANTGTGAAYLTIRNTGGTADTLITAATDASQTVEIHAMEIVDGVMSMRELENGLEIPAQGDVVLEPGGYHVMLVNLNHDLNPGSSFELTMTFANAGNITITIPVQTESPTDTIAGTVGSLELRDAWSRPAPMLDDCGCTIPDSVQDMNPAATPDA